VGLLREGGKEGGREGGRMGVQQQRTSSSSNSTGGKRSRNGRRREITIEQDKNKGNVFLLYVPPLFYLFSSFLGENVNIFVSLNILIN